MNQPPNLAVFLDYGGDLAGFAGLEALVEAVVVRRRLNSPEQNLAQVVFYRDCVERWLADDVTPLDGLAGGGFSPTQTALTAFTWAAECYEDPALATRFEAALPVDLYVEHIQWVNERRARA